MRFISQNKGNTANVETERSHERDDKMIKRVNNEQGLKCFL